MPTPVLDLTSVILSKVAASYFLGVTPPAPDSSCGLPGADTSRFFDATLTQSSNIRGIITMVDLSEGDAGMSKIKHRLRALIFDHDGEVAKLVTDILAGISWDVTRAQPSDPFRETFTYPCPFDAVIMHLTGATAHFLGMIPAIKRISPKAQIFVVSRSADEGLWLNVLEHGASDLFASPPNRTEFLDSFLRAVEANTLEEVGQAADAA
jgi:hypothetical protein